MLWWVNRDVARWVSRSVITRVRDVKVVGRVNSKRVSAAEALCYRLRQCVSSRGINRYTFYDTLFISKIDDVNISQ